jgi:hypothetical protein
MTATTDPRTAPRVAERMAAAARSWLESLTAAQRARATFPFDNETERRRFFYTPAARGGLPLTEMAIAQQQLAMKLVASGLSRVGYNTAATIVGLDWALDRREGFLERAYPGGDEQSRFRNVGMYFTSVFGEPGGDAPWGWRFGGHHVCLQYTVTDGAVVSPTPTFFGAHPAELPLAAGNVMRTLAREEDLGRELIRALDDARRGTAIIAPHAPEDIITHNAPRVVDALDVVPGWRMMGFADSDDRFATRQQFRDRLELTDDDDAALRLAAAPVGLPARAMTATQREILAALIRQYVDRMPDEIADVESRRLAEVMEDVHFAWAGGIERGEPHYYRLHGPRLLIEYDNTQDDVNHVHSVWRDPDGDFGADLLREHYAQAHGAKRAQ